MKRKAKEGKLDSSQPEGSLGIEKAQGEELWLWGTSQLAAWDQNVAFKEPASQQWTDDENWQAGPYSTEVCSRGPGCSCNANEPSFHRSQQPPFSEHTVCQSLSVTLERRLCEHTAP